MKKEARVLIVEDDPFARNWMALLLARDWRARVTGEAGSWDEMLAYFKSPAEKPNCVLINTDLLGTAPEAALGSLPGAPLVLLIGKTPSLSPGGQPLRLPFPNFGGWLLKREIRYALGWAVALADAGQWVVTPGTAAALRPARAAHTTLSGTAGGKVLVLDGRKSIHNLTEHEAEVARMALIFSMERRELSDELKISADWSYGLVSSIYHKLGMDEIQSGEIDAVEFLGKQFAENPRFQETLKQAGKARRTDLESLAFHILTMPEIEEIE